MNFEMVVQTVKGVVPVTRFGATRQWTLSWANTLFDAQKSVAFLILFEFPIIVFYFFLTEEIHFFFQIRVYLNVGIFFLLT